jgi:hypothetical protein
MDAKNLVSQLGDPKNEVDILLSLISAGTGIPKRILIGSEVAQLASKNDRNNWGDKVESHQINFLNSIFIRPFIDYMVSFGIVKEPKKKTYTIEWKDTIITDVKTQAEVAKLVAEAFQAYVDGNVDAIIDPITFMVRFMGMSLAKAEDIFQKADAFKELTIRNEDNSSKEENNVVE